MSRKISALSWGWIELADNRVNGNISVLRRFSRLLAAARVAYLTFGFAASGPASAAPGTIDRQE
jgi:hypothetical protein